MPPKRSKRLKAILGDGLKNLSFDYLPFMLPTSPKGSKLRYKDYNSMRIGSYEDYLNTCLILDASSSGVIGESSFFNNF